MELPHDLIVDLARHLRATLRLALRHRTLVGYAEGGNDLIRQAFQLERRLHRYEASSLTWIWRPPWIPPSRGMLRMKLRLIDDDAEPHDFEIEYRLGEGAGKWDLTDPEQCVRLANALRRHYLEWEKTRMGSVQAEEES